MNGALYDWILSQAERSMLGALRERLLRPLAGRIVEVGAGTGVDFAHYDRAAHVLALEPDPAMARRARRRAAEAAAAIDLRVADDRWLDTLPAGSIDAVVFPLVLCTVDDAAVTLARAHRVLRASGKIVFLEHVRSAGRTGRVQDALTPAWQKIAGGCHLNRDTAELVAAAGFAIAQLDERRLPWFSPVQRLIAGEAVPLSPARVVARP
ncbi:MAG: class I SAM-dependent methyltransferase [Vulcanimicrobiaceae bacterium]